MNLFSKQRLIILILILATSTNISLATDYETIQDGLAIAASTWVGGVVPPSFSSGNHADGDKIIIKHSVYYDADYTADKNIVFQIDAGGVFVTKVFKMTGSGSSLVVNGVLICFEVYQVSGAPVSGNGTIIANKYQGNTPPQEITVIDGIYIWTGGTNNDWTNASNWLNNALPISGSAVCIAPAATNQPIIKTDVSLGALYIAINQEVTIDTEGTLRITTTTDTRGRTLSTSANVYKKGGLIIKSGNSKTGSVILDNPALFVNPGAIVNVERYLPSTAQWHVISSPVAGQQMGNFATTNSLRMNGSNYALAPYNVSADNWSPYTLATGATTFQPGKGYEISKATEGVVTFTGTGLNAGSLTYALETSGYKWNAIGNPYTSAIYAKGAVTPAENFLTVNAPVIDDSYEGLYVWDYEADDYKVISVGGGGFGGKTDIGWDKIAVGQGFIVKAALTGNISFSLAMQVHETGAPFKSAEISSPAIRLTVKSGTHENSTILAFESESTPGLDPGYDVGKLKGNPNIALFTRLIDRSSDIDFAIQSLPDAPFEMKVIPVGLDLKNGGKATFTLETVSFPAIARVYLQDNLLNTYTQLNKERTEYTIDLPPVQGVGRFNLVVADFKSAEISTGAEVLEKPNLTVYTRDRAIYIGGNLNANDIVTVYGVDGKLHCRKNVEKTGLLRIDAVKMPAGIYLIHIEQKANRVTRKVVISE